MAAGGTPSALRASLITRPVVGLTGRSVRNSTYLGIAKYGSSDLRNEKNSGASGADSELHTMHALISSSPNGEGTAQTATCATAGCCAMASSSSNEDTFSPRRRSASFLRSTNVITPSASAWAFSPVWGQRVG